MVIKIEDFSKTTNLVLDLRIAKITKTKCMREYYILLGSQAWNREVSCTRCPRSRPRAKNKLEKLHSFPLILFFTIYSPHCSTSH